MSGQWKPGDLATFGHSLALRTAEGWAYSDGSVGGPHQDTYAKRLLVVIDPEDSEQVERLRDALWDRQVTCAAVNTVQAALREFANPTPPKPEEPTGLGAVVEASAYTEQRRPFVRCASDESAWMDEGGNGHDWSELDDPRVLSEGWSE